MKRGKSDTEIEVKLQMLHKWPTSVKGRSLWVKNDTLYQRCGNNNMRETDKPRHLNKEISIENNMDNILNHEPANTILEKIFSFLMINSKTSMGVI